MEGEARPSAPSVGSVGNACDNAHYESTTELLEAELIRPDAPWRGVEHVKLKMLGWID